MICEPGKSDKRSEITFSGGLPYGCIFTEDGNIQVVCSDGMYLFDPNSGAIINDYPFVNSNISRISMTNDGIAVTVSGQLGVASNVIFIFDKNGNIIYNIMIDGGIIDMEYKSEYLFINRSTSIERINIKNNERKSSKITEEGADIIIYDSGNILVCCPTKAIYIKI